MKLLRSEKIVNILENTLNHVDSRLVGHGKRLAHLMYRVLKGKYKDAELRDICLLAMLHDVGAYKTEEIDNTHLFETRKVWEHSIYGFLFLKYFSPLKHLSGAVLHHHSSGRQTEALNNPELQMLAQLIGLTNAADMYSIHDRSGADFRAHIERRRGTMYRADIINLFLAADIQIETIADDMEKDMVFHKLLYNTPLTEGEAYDYFKMIISSIDFRSSQTVIHTRAVSCVAQVMARLMGATQEEVEKIKTAALLHDIGKIGTPVHILEATGRLSDGDMEIMRNHVVVSEKILAGNVDDEIKNIAVNHHERPDGTGYPKKLHLTPPLERLMAVADVFSALCGARSYKAAFPKEKIIGILENMAAKNHLDAQLAALAVRHYDEVMAAASHETDVAIADYEAIGKEYEKLLVEFSEANDGV